MSSIPAVLVESLEKRYGDRRALRGVSFAIPRGSRLVVFGANGAGKTTLLRILALLERPSTGTLTILGHDARKEGDEIRAQLGFISHQPFVYLDLTARENLMLTARLHGLDGPEARVARMLDDVRLTHRRDDVVRGFSRGMLQRLSIARALLCEPSLVLLDEPYTGLDQSAMAVAEQLFGQDAGSGDPLRTVVMTSHDLAAGFATATHVLLLSHGRPVLFSEAAELSYDELAEVYSRELGRGGR